MVKIENTTRQRRKKPSFSVLMSVYAGELPTFLDQALTSIENQTVLPKEIVLVEDGPINDQLQKVVDYHQKLDGSRFKIIKSTFNQGLGAALRLGTRFITTDWVARMDTDDIAVPNRFALQLQQIKANPRLAVLGGQIDEFIDIPQKVVGHRHVPLNNQDIVNFAKWRCPFNHPTVMIKRSALLAVGGYQQFGTYEDYYLWARLIARGYLAQNLPNILVHMRTSKDMYARRGQVKNIKYIMQLRQYLYKKKIINARELVLGNIMQTTNMIIPNSLRRLIYTKLIHRR